MVDQRSCAHPGCVAVAGLGAVAFGGAAALFIRHGNEGPAVFFGIVAAAFAFLLLWLLLLAQQASLVDVAFDVNPLQVRLGEQLRIRAVVSAKRNVPLTRGKLELRCLERAISRGGTSDTTYTHLAYTDEQPVDASQTLSEGMSWIAEGVFVIPDGLPPSFAGRNNFIEWTVNFRIGLRGPLLDITRSQSIVVKNERV